MLPHKYIHSPRKLWQHESTSSHVSLPQIFPFKKNTRPNASTWFFIIAMPICAVSPEYLLLYEWSKAFTTRYPWNAIDVKNTTCNAVEKKKAKVWFRTLVRKNIVSLPIMRCFRRQAIKTTWVANELPNAGTSLGFLYVTSSIGFSLWYWPKPIQSIH